MKKLLITFLIFGFILAIILLSFPEGPVSTVVGAEEGNENLSQDDENRASDASATTPPISPPSHPSVSLSPIDYKLDPIALNRERANSPFEFRGGAGTGRLTDKKGNVLLDSSEGFSIFGISVGPDREKVLIDAANSLGGNCLVFEPLKGRKIKLPSRPPGENMFSLSWYWINSNLLLGISGVELIHDHDDKHEGKSCCNESNVVETRFYTFDLKSEQLAALNMPSSITLPVVKAVDVTSDGHIHLMYEKPQDGIEQDLGWFKFDVTE